MVGRGRLERPTNWLKSRPCSIAASRSPARETMFRTKRWPRPTARAVLLFVFHKKTPVSCDTRVVLYGGSWATRTPDQLVKSQLIYQLS